MGDDKATPRLRVIQAEKNKQLANTVKDIEAKDELQKTRKKEAIANKENKENKKEEKKMTKDNESLVKAIITEMDKNNKQKQEINLITMKQLTQTMANTMAIKIKTLITNLTEKLTDTIKEGIREANTEKTKETEDDNLATQTIINEIQRINERLNTETQDKPNNKQTKPDSETTPKPPNIPNIYAEITKVELIKTINNMIDHINILEKNHSTTPTEKTPQKPTKQVYLPAINLDTNDDPTNHQEPRTEEQPLDWTRVKTARKVLPDRPPIPEQVQEEVKKDLKSHIKEQQNKNIRTRPQQQMEDQTRLDKIREMLRKQTLVVGIAPITSSHLEAIEQKMIDRGAMSKNQPNELRKQRTIKSVIRSWAFKNLKLSEESWDSIQMEEIVQTQSEGSDIIFIKCKEEKDAQMITQNAKNLPQDTEGQGPRLVSYIDSRAKARHRAYIQIAKTLRENATKTIQTNIRTGRNDFLLRMREKGDPTPWSLIPPLKVTQKLPNFEVGLYKSVNDLSFSATESEPEPEDIEDEEELNRVQKSLEKEQMEAARKRDRTSDEDSDNHQTKHRSTPHPRGRNQKNQLPESTSDSSDEDKDSKPPHKALNRSLNKTLVPETPAKENNKQTSQSVKETPINTRSKSSTRMEHD